MSLKPNDHHDGLRVHSITLPLGQYRSYLILQKPQAPVVDLNLLPGAVYIESSARSNLLHI